MTREEFAKIIMILNSSYRSQGYKMISDDMQADVWYEMLGDLEYEIAIKAVRNYIARSPYQPKISDIRQEYARLVSAPALGEAEAWSMVREAIRNGIYGATEEFARLPETVQKAVGTPDSLSEWAMLSPKEIETVVQSNFLKSLRAEQERATQDVILGQIGAKDGAYAQLVDNLAKKMEVTYEHDGTM